jgi:hypothetical protein
MPRISEAALRDLRLRYNSAHAAHQGCARAVTEAASSGVTPSADLLTNEAEALRQLIEARTKLLAAMAEG